MRGLGAVLAVLLVIGFAADAYAQTFFDSLPSIQGLDSAAFAGDTIITRATASCWPTWATTATTGWR